MILSYRPIALRIWKVRYFSKHLAIFVELKFCVASKFWCGLLDVAWLKIGLSERAGK